MPNKLTDEEKEGKKDTHTKTRAKTTKCKDKHAFESEKQWKPKETDRESVRE
jgi:hypothetical protein